MADKTAEKASESIPEKKKTRKRRTMSPDAIRFDMDLSSEDLKALDEVLKISNRSRKNFAETLVLMTIRVYQKNEAFIDIRGLGVMPKIGQDVKPSVLAAETALRPEGARTLTPSPIPTKEEAPVKEVKEEPVRKVPLDILSHTSERTHTPTDADEAL